jgi:hypothetical protein
LRENPFLTKLGQFCSWILRIAFVSAGAFLRARVFLRGNPFLTRLVQ